MYGISTRSSIRLPASGISTRSSVGGSKQAVFRSDKHETTGSNPDRVEQNCQKQRMAETKDSKKRLLTITEWRSQERTRPIAAGEALFGSGWHPPISHSVGSSTCVEVSRRSIDQKP